MRIPPISDSSYSKFMREYTLKKFEGFHVNASHVVHMVENDSIADANLVKAY